MVAGIAIAILTVISIGMAGSILDLLGQANKNRLLRRTLKRRDEELLRAQGMHRAYCAYADKKIYSLTCEIDHQKWLVEAIRKDVKKAEAIAERARNGRFFAGNAVITQLDEDDHGQSN